jgi:hypothetical protein
LAAGWRREKLIGKKKFDPKHRQPKSKTLKKKKSIDEKYLPAQNMTNNGGDDDNMFQLRVMASPHGYSQKDIDSILLIIPPNREREVMRALLNSYPTATRVVATSVRNGDVITVDRSTQRATQGFPASDSEFVLETPLVGQLIPSAESH